MDGKTLGLIIGLSLGVGLIVIAVLVYIFLKFRNKDSGIINPNNQEADTAVKM